MGYTHYWDRPPSIDPVAYGHMITDAQRILAACVAQGIAVAGWDGTGSLTCTPDELAFNGNREAGEHDETFRFDRESPDPFSCCKTGHRPYDLAVTAMLVAIKHHIPEVHVHSDGTSSDWDAARNLCQAVCGYGADFALDS
ncbi:hypothetical protein [Sulfobacillus thermosulfidooxidans]|uniref:hypothetical protein n=1 Tax=Sulfobacillus thermosulfidooxidans TaxID=28034 RepID=UPI0006B43C73|nr:hypothetical protein [Sulfobacillus thermosulfidooxidans]